MDRAWLVIAVMPALLAQRNPAQASRGPLQAQSSSSISYKTENGAQTIEILNTSYEVVGPGVPVRPREEQLVLRRTTRTKQVVDEIGMEAITSVDAWPLGVDPKGKPLYAFKVAATECRVVDANLLVAARGLEEVEWWSVYKLGSGAHLFDTYVPLVRFSISREVQTLRYVGLEVPPDDATDARLKEPHVVAALTYASPERVIREALITSDDPKQAAILRSYADASRSVALVEQNAARSLRISISQNYPSPSATVTITIPISGDDLDMSHAQAPARLHVAAWKR